MTPSKQKWQRHNYRRSKTTITIENLIWNIKWRDMAWFLPNNFATTRPSIKLNWKKIGPLKITTMISSNAYKWDLEPWMGILNSFHISLLKTYQGNKFLSETQKQHSTVQREGEEEYELEEIIDSRLHYHQLQYRALLTRYQTEYDEVWYPASKFRTCREHNRTISLWLSTESRTG